MKGFDFKRALPYLVALLAFVVIAYSYTPAVLSGKVVNQSDISSWRGMANEILTHNEANPDDKALWTNSMFGGMPATSISVIYEGDITKPLYDLLFLGERPASYYLLSMIGGFLLMLSFGANVWLSFLGAIAITFCSYNIQIIQVGHNSKMVAIAFMPWVLAAVVYAYRKSALWGGVLFAFVLSFQIKANHPQITYYLAMIIFGYAIWQFCAAIKERALPKFFKVSFMLLFSGLVGIATNINHLWPTYEYAQHTMRGGSELTGGDGSLESGEKSRSGLDLEYATAWSYGIDETPNLLIPNFNGGSSSGELGRNSETYKVLRQNGYAAEQIVKALPLYWGPQPFTAGPMYMGAVSLFLALFGLFVIRGGLKWWVCGVSLVALLLSWGYHFMPMSELFFNYAPLYNKFRTVSMILVILQILIPVMAVLAIKSVLYPSDDTKGDTVIKFLNMEIRYKERVQMGFLLSLGVTAAFCLIFALIPSLAGDFISGADSQMPDLLLNSLRADRASLLRSDALRSLCFILLAAVALWLGISKKIKADYAVALLALLILVDMWSVGKRYLNDSHFVTQKEFNNAFTLRTADEFILEDQDPDYRVLDLSVNTFNDAYVSYHHKTIGGYSPAKLQRYQDLIDHHISKEISAVAEDLSGVATLGEAQEALGDYPVLNMLNTKYIVIDGNMPPLVNEPYGNCWFVSNIVKAANANEEIEKLGHIDPSKEVVIADNFVSEEYLGDFYAPVANSRGLSFFFEADSAATIELVSYSPNRVVYHYESDTPNVALFSEVFYAPGWRAWLKESAAGSQTGNSADDEAVNGKTTDSRPQSVESNQPSGTAPGGQQPGSVPGGQQPSSASGSQQLGSASGSQQSSSAAGSQQSEVAAVKDQTNMTELKIFRGNYILRGAVLPQGKGEIIFEFAPDSFIKGELYSRNASAILIGMLAGAIGITIFGNRNKQRQNR